MKLMYKRAVSVLALSFLLILGLGIFIFKYALSSSDWVQYPVNKHLYYNGELIRAGIIYDRNGEILAQTIDGKRVFNEDWTTRVAVMHSVGDPGGNVSTGAQVIYGDKLSGWDPVNGVYKFDEKASSGMNITLTLDSKLCATAYKALGWRKGAVGVFNYKTGEILCMVSTPSFDPQYPPDIEDDPAAYEGVYLNRFLSAAYTPGSVFKLVTAAAAIDEIEDIEEQVFHCEGKTLVGDVLVTCPSAHGDVSFEQALADSCNVAFAQITLELGGRKLQHYTDKMGLNSALTVSGISTAAGRVDVADAEGADLAWAGIGQYTDTVNPLNFMAFVGAIANDGVRVTPCLIADEGVFAKLSSAGGKTRILSRGTAEKLGEMMRNNVISKYGDYNYSGLELCAKSGTGEVGGDKYPNSWFVGYLDRDDCPLAFVVIIEEGGSGSGVAGPVANQIMQVAVENMIS